mgnify:CR=1 FL=1
MNILIWSLSICIVLFQFADFWTTKKVIERGGAETNPIVYALMYKIGIVPALILLKGSVAVAVLAGAFLGWFETTLGVATLALLFGVYGAVVQNNLREYNKR